MCSYSKEELLKLANEVMVIYKLTNLINGKVYIGQTVRTFNKRYTGAGVGAERMKKYYEIRGNIKNEHLYNSLIKYGTDNFKVEIIEQCKTIDELNEKEEYYIELYNSTDYKKGYNIQYGGDNHRRSYKWRIEKLFTNDSDKIYFTSLIEQGLIDKDYLFDLINSPVLYIKKGGAKKYWKNYFYRNMKVCCEEHGMTVEEGFRMAMRKKDNSRHNKEIYKHVPITKHEIWFKEDVEDWDNIVFERKKIKDTSNMGRPRKNEKINKKREYVIHYKPCPICGKITQSRFRMCADCKRAKENNK